MGGTSVNIQGVEEDSMTVHISFHRFFRLVRREGADHYLFLVFIGFAGSVSLTRFFLSLTNYPQIAGGELHIAHALWGGLLLFIASLLPLTLSNKRIFTASALIGGIGVGLFIDEVGKFITKSNDYFFPAAASIVYTFLLITTILLLRFRRPPGKDNHAELSRAMEMVQQSLHEPLNMRERLRLEKQLENIIQEHEQGEFGRLAQDLLVFIQKDERCSAEKRPTWYQAILKRTLDWVSMGKLRVALILCLVGLGLISLKNPLGFFLERWADHPAWLDTIIYITAGRHLENLAAPALANVRIVLELCVGTLFLSAALLMLVRQARPGVFIALTGLLISFTSTNILVFYFEQFSTFIMVGAQFIILFGLLEYRRRLHEQVKGDLAF